MMSKEQVKVVTQAYNHLLKNEERGWDALDNSIGFLEYLDDGELIREAQALYLLHRDSAVSCTEDHPKDKCFVPIIIEAVAAILELYEEHPNLHEKNKYIIQYYLAMDQDQMFVVEVV